MRLVSGTFNLTVPAGFAVEQPIHVSDSKGRRNVTAHVIMLTKGTGCTHCGEDWPFIPDGRGLPLDLVIAASKAFEKCHKKCKQLASALWLTKPKTLDEWARSWIVGASSAAIFCTLTGLMPPQWPHGRSAFDAPHDGSDFWRCMTLLDIAPEFRTRLGEVAAAVPAFAPLVPEWARLEALCRADKGPELYAEIGRLRGSR